MFDAPPSVALPGGTPRFGDPNSVWPSEPSEDTAAKLQRMNILLAKRLGPEYLSTRQGPGGGKLTYLEGWRAISLANEVFGFNGWSSSVRDISIDFLDYNEETGRWNVHVTALVRVTLPDGCYHEDVGCGKMDNCKSKADALDKVKKEAVTDAMKRALRNFGSLMGNCIYDKNFLNDIAKVKPPGKTPLDFSTLHRPGQVYDSDGKIIGIAKAETSKGPASATTAGQQNEGVSNNKMPDQVPRNAAHQNQKQVVPVVQQNKPQAPAQRPPQLVRQQQPNQQYTNQQQNRLQAQQQALGQQSTTASTISAGQNAIHTRSTATLNRNPAQVKLQDAVNKSLNSEDMLYEGMDFEEESTQIEIGAGKYDDSGFEEGDSVMRANNEADQSISGFPQMAKNGQNGQNWGAIPQQPQPARQGPPQTRAPPQVRPPHPNGAPRVQNGQNGPITPMMEQQSRVKQEPVVIMTGNNQNQPHVRRISGGAPSSAEGRPQLPVQADQIEDVHASQHSRFQPGGSSGSRNRPVGAQAQGSSPLQHLQSQGMHSQGGTIGFAPPPAGVAVPESVTFTTARGIKRNFAETEQVQAASVLCPAIQSALQEGIRRPMSPSERARQLEDQAHQQQQQIEQNRLAALEKRQRMQAGRSSGIKPLSA